MNRKLIDFLLGTSVLLDAPTDGGGGGGDGTSTDQGAGAVTPPAQEPSAIDVDDNSLIRVKGQNKPIKFSEYGRSFQAQFTKASQEAARLKRELETERQTRQRYEQERQRAAQQQPNQNGQADVYAQLESLPYLSGKDARAVVESIGQAITQRDHVLLAALKKIQAMEQRVGGLYENHTMQNFEGKISRWLQEGGYDQGYADLAKEIYLAYEGDDLDTEFPQIFASRVKQIEDIWEKTRQAKINAARKAPFVPGKGGNTGPSRMTQLKPAASAAEIADSLWDSMQTGSDT